MEILAIIPARSQSKGIINKNIAILNGKHLLEYTCLAAKQSTGLNRVILTTDSHHYSTICNQYGIETPFLRPKELSGDDIPMLPVMKHAIEFLKTKDNYKPDSVVLLSPTCPLRTSSHIDEAIEKYNSIEADVLVSVVKVPHNMTPESIMIEKGSFIELYNKKNPIFIRQKKKKYYARNGPAILIINTEYMMRCNHFYEGTVFPYVMSDKDSIDIDYDSDLLVAAKILAEKGN